MVRARGGWQGAERRLIAACAALVLAACAAHPRYPIWDAGRTAFVSQPDAFARVYDARVVLLGEVHDNPRHHAIQDELLARLIAAGRRPALVMEMLDREDQGAIDRARATGDPDAIAAAARFNERGWDWPAYRPLVARALAAGLPIVAANLSRPEAMRIARGVAESTVKPLAPAASAALREAIMVGHCNKLPEAAVAGMMRAQQARDAVLAMHLERSAAAAGMAVLIAGNGHVRRDHGVPAYLERTDGVLAIGLLESESRQAPAPGLFDLVWITPVYERPDPCRDFRTPK